MSSRSTLIVPFALVMIAAPVVAQSDWVSRCVHGNQGDDRETHCEGRESRLSTRPTVIVDAGRSGGVSVEGWDRDEILVQARIQAHAPTMAEAREIARQVRIELGE